MSEVITIARLNNLQSRIALILGNGSGQKGYGQVVTSSQVVNNSSAVVKADHINKLFIDLIKARIHQVGYTDFINSSLKIAEVIKETSEVGLDSSPNIVINSETGEVSFVNDANSAFRGISDYEKLMDQIEIDKFLAHSSQMTVELGLSSVRTTPWNKEVYHEFVVNFANTNHRRYFFNAGGKLFINTSLLNPGGDKAEDWAAFLSSTGTITFGHTETTGQQTGTLIGNYDLTASYQKIFERIGGGSVSGVYSGNLITIYAKEVSESAISFKVVFSDVAQDSGVDDLIVGRLESSVSCLIPDGVFSYNTSQYTSVSLTPPKFSTLTSLDSFLAPVSVYSLYTNKTSVVKNDTFRITVSTLNVVDSTSVPYTITGVTSADISNAPLTGNFVISSNKDFKTFTVASNIDEDKNFRLKINNLPNQVNILFNKTPIPLPNNATRTCIAVIDEVSPSSTTIRNSWLAFRSRWPNRPFYLLQPRSGAAATNKKIPGNLYVPNEFRSDPLAHGSYLVSKDIYAETGTGDRPVTSLVPTYSDWYTICDIQDLPDNSKIAVWFDKSGSMKNDVNANYANFLTQLQARNITTMFFTDSSENWITPFDRDLI